MKKLKKPQLIIFDVNETLLDMEPVRAAINKFFKSESAFQIWFSYLLQYAMVESINPPQPYRNFGEIAQASLLMVSKKFEKSLSDTEVKDLLSLMSQLEPHTDVYQGLMSLKDKGYKLVALTNGTVEVLRKQMAATNLSQYFDAAYSVESVKSFKPQKIAYEYVLKEELVSSEEAMMVAAHSWDIFGAQAAGLQTAFVAREGQQYYPLLKEPTFTVMNLIDLARKI